MSCGSAAAPHPERAVSRTQKENTMNLLLIIVVVAAIVLALVGGLVEALQFLLWVGIILLVLAVIAWLLRMISGRRV
jgi:hypothetical protein